MKGRVIITGASGSIGAVVTRELAASGCPVVMACRNPRKAETVRGSIIADYPGAEIGILPLDLASMASVRAFVDSLGPEPVEALFNNAATISKSYSMTLDGLENTFAVNYFGPVLLTRLLLPKMAPEARIVNMVSLTCRYVSVDENSLRPVSGEFSQLGTYARAKLAMLRFSMELARRRTDFRINLADPGIVNSNMISMGRWFDPLADILFRPFCKSPSKGAIPALAALSSPEGNRYFVGKRCMAIPSRFSDPELDLRLWAETEKIIQL